MAASLSPTQRHEDFKEEFLTCSICTESYDNDQHQAKCLPCLHTYCKSCLQKHTGKRPKFNCPNCRSLVTLPGGTLDGLPSNFIVENLKEYHDIFNLAVTCGSCEDEGNQAISFCHDCGCFLCQTCVDAHARLGPRLRHQLSTMVELQDQKCNPMAQRNQPCKKHPKQDLALFCKEQNCKIPVCALCGLVDHRGHDLIDLAASIEEIIADLQRSTANIESKNQEIAKKSAETKAKQKTLTDNFNQKEKELLQSKQKLTNLIDSQYTKAQSNLKSLYQREMNCLSSTSESLDSLAAQMTSACEFANHACDTSNRGQILTSQNQIMTRLFELEIKDLPAGSSSVKRGLTFTDQHHTSVKKITEFVEHLFDTDWEKKQQTTAPGFLAYEADMPVGSTRRKLKKSKKSSSAKILYPAVDPNLCTITFQQCMLNTTATVQIVDFSGELVTYRGSAKVDAQAEDEEADAWNSYEVIDNNDGTYKFTCRENLVHVKIDGIPMTESPFKAPFLL